MQLPVIGTGLCPPTGHIEDELKETRANLFDRCFAGSDASLHQDLSDPTSVLPVQFVKPP